MYVQNCKTFRGLTFCGHSVYRIYQHVEVLAIIAYIAYINSSKQHSALYLQQ